MDFVYFVALSINRHVCKLAALKQCVHACCYAHKIAQNLPTVIKLIAVDSVRRVFDFTEIFLLIDAAVKPKIEVAYTDTINYNKRTAEFKVDTYSSAVLFSF